MIAMPIFDRVVNSDDGIDTAWPAVSTSRVGLQILVLCEFCVAPKVLDVVELPSFPVKNMHHCVEEVHAYPTGVLNALDMQGELTKLILQPLVDIVGDGLDLRVGVPFTDDEKIRGGIVEFSEVKFHDVFSFDVLNAVDDHIVQRFNGGEVSY